MSKPFLTFVTRCYKRPRGLIRAHESIRSQTDQDFNHVLLVDRKGIGIHEANQSFWRCRRFVNGHYVYILDDDDQLIDNEFVAELKKFVVDRKSDVVMVKIERMGAVFPEPEWWNHPPIMCRVATPNFVVRNEIWQEHIKHFRNPSGVGGGGDFFFISSVFKQTSLKIHWWNRVVAKVDQIGKGRAEKL